MRGLAIVLVALVGMVSCQTSENYSRYSDMAKANTFEYFFPAATDVRTFDTLDEANDYISAAQLKLGSSINKQSAKGLAAKLTGPVVTDAKPVVVFHFFNASTATSSIDIRNSTKPLDQNLLEAISVSSVFLVFYGDRATSISDFYLASNYHYNSNSQYKGFIFRRNSYSTEYPIGWGTSAAFKYLNKEID